MNIWILNHYAMPPSLGGLNRHHYFSKCLKETGHSVRIVTSSVIHSTDINIINDKKLYSEQTIDGVEYTYVRGSGYKDNGAARIWNMLEFPLRMARVCKKFPAPDVIYASSPDIFTAAMAILISGRLKRPCVVEIRDLWPEAIVENKGISRKNPGIMALYKLEKWIYKKADRVVFTMEGGRDYIAARGWDKEIDINKIYHINNGVYLSEFDSNARLYAYDDPDLDNNDCFKVIYAGSIRFLNNLKVIVETAEILQRENRSIKIFIFGDGSYRWYLDQYAKDKGLRNIFFKGRVDNKYLASILTKGHLCLINYRVITQIGRFGSSQNKLFTYMAAGKPILNNVTRNYDLISKYNCGVTLHTQSPREIADAIIEMSSLDKGDYDKYCKNSRLAAHDYDYKTLTEKLLEILQGVLK